MRDTTLFTFHTVRSRSRAAALVALALASAGAAFGNASLTPTRDALFDQAREAHRQGFTRLDDARDVDAAVRAGTLVRLPGNADYEVKEDVRYPYGLPELKSLVEQLAAGYHAACGERLVVTSVVRPRSQRLRNSSPFSVHPTGMAVDLRRSWSHRCRSWLAAELLYLEAAGVVEAAQERRPPHFHVVVLPEQYRAWRRQLANGDATTRLASRRYRVRRGDSLWSIASRHNTTVERLRAENRLRSTLIRPGQLLAIPGR